MSGAGEKPDQEQPAFDRDPWPAPRHPTPLPPERAAVLQHQPYGCVTVGSDRGTLFVLKAPRADIASARGAVPLGMTVELYAHPAGPVLRLVLTIADRPDAPLRFETFLNPDDPAHHADVAALARQEECFVLFYDEDLTHRVSKVVRNRHQDALTRALIQADACLAATPRAQRDFDRAKHAVQEQTPL